MVNKWIAALKLWNTAKDNGNWCVPKKGSKEIEQVRRIMRGEKEPPAVAPKIEAPPRPKKSTTKVEQMDQAPSGMDILERAAKEKAAKLQDKKDKAKKTILERIEKYGAWNAFKFHMTDMRNDKELSPILFGLYKTYRTKAIGKKQSGEDSEGNRWTPSWDTL